MTDNENNKITLVINAPYGDAFAIGRSVEKVLADHRTSIQKKTFRELGLVGWIARAWRNLLAKSTFLGGVRT